MVTKVWGVQEKPLLRGFPHKFSSCVRGGVGEKRGTSMLAFIVMYSRNLHCLVCLNEYVDKNVVLTVWNGYTEALRFVFLLP